MLIIAQVTGDTPFPAPPSHAQGCWGRAAISPRRSISSNSTKKVFSRHNQSGHCPALSAAFGKPEALGEVPLLSPSPSRVLPFARVPLSPPPPPESSPSWGRETRGAAANFPQGWRLPGVTENPGIAHLASSKSLAERRRGGLNCSRNKENRVAFQSVHAPAEGGGAGG